MAWKCNKLLIPVGLAVILRWWILKPLEITPALHVERGNSTGHSFRCLKQLASTDMGWLCYPTPALSCTLCLPAGADPSPCGTPKSDSLTSDAAKNNKQTRTGAGFCSHRSVWGAPEQHNSSSQSVWLEKTPLFVVAVSCRNVPSHSLHGQAFLSIPGIRALLLSAPKHWLSLPAIVVFALGLWKSVCDTTAQENINYQWAPSFSSAWYVFSVRINVLHLHFPAPDSSL